MNFKYCENFEKWADDEGFSIAKGSNGVYVSTITLDLWRAWRTAARHLSREPDIYDAFGSLRAETELAKLQEDYTGLQSRYNQALVELAQLKREIANYKSGRKEPMS